MRRSPRRTGELRRFRRPILRIDLGLFEPTNCRIKYLIAEISDHFVSSLPWPSSAVKMLRTRHKLWRFLDGAAPRTKTLPNRAMPIDGLPVRSPRRRTSTMSTRPC